MIKIGNTVVKAIQTDGFAEPVISYKQTLTELKDSKYAF
jgi:hypothetical protein